MLGTGCWYFVWRRIFVVLLYVLLARYPVDARLAVFPNWLWMVWFAW